MKYTALDVILADFGAGEYRKEIERMAKSVVFITKIKYELRCVVVAYLHLQQEGFPVVTEDVLKYAETSKTGFLSTLSKNRKFLPYREEYSILYLKNVYRRFHAESEKMNMSPVQRVDMLEKLHKRNYFHNRSPMLACLCLCLEGKPTETILEAYKNLAGSVQITARHIEKEILRISEEVGKTHKKTTDKTRAKRKQREAKISEAVNMYRTQIKDIEKYSSDYESMLIETLVKKGHSPETIHNLTKNGMEYYSDFTS